MRWAARRRRSLNHELRDPYVACPPYIHTHSRGAAIVFTNNIYKDSRVSLGSVQGLSFAQLWGERGRGPGGQKERQQRDKKVGGKGDSKRRRGVGQRRRRTEKPAYGEKR